MNTILKTALVFLLAFSTTTAIQAQSKADRIVGVYKAVEEGKESKVRFSRQADGSYRGQIIWLKNPNNADGTPKLDAKNPDKAKRTQRADQAVVVDGIRYNADEDVWDGGRVYDPTKGKTYKVEVSFDSPAKLRVKGSLLGISRSVYWTKIE